MLKSVGLTEGSIMKITNKKLLPVARKLRKNMTPQEKQLWYQFLSKHQLRWYKQRIIGNFIADFYCPQIKLVIELDGSQHYSDEGLSYDENRTKIINEYGIEVIRISNTEIDSNFINVCNYINEEIKKRMKA